MADFLLEIGTEEIPARMIPTATGELTRRVRDLIARERLGRSSVASESGSTSDIEIQIEAFSTPRRLAVFAHGVIASQPDVEEQVLGPSLKVAYKDGQPTPAAHAFAKKVNVDVAKLQQVSTPKGDYLAANVTRKGRSAGEIFSEFLPKEIASLYWAKNMYWRGKSAERFVRPVRWLVAMLDRQVVPLEFAGITASNATRGHRVLSDGMPQIAKNGRSHEITIQSPGRYVEALTSGFVIPTAAQREHIIRKALDAATRTLHGARWREDSDLLATVVNLTEFPAVILGNFDSEYLALPEEVLVTVMRDHQKYFAVEDTSGKLAPHFLAVLNTSGDPEGLIRHGNERVLRARFNDARFFWTTDQKIPLRDRVQSLKSVTFQKDLGSYYAKTERLGRLAARIADDLAAAGLELSRNAVCEAAQLAKTDLTTELVKEFTELQGIVGGLYAVHQGHDAAVGSAIYDQYKPESMEDAVPRTMEGAVLAIADKSDSIAGMFALGLVPSGSKDPFALRRAANGIVRIIAEHKLPLSLRQLMRDALDGYQGSEAENKFTNTGERLSEDLDSFFRERLEFYLRDAKGFAYDVVNAVLAANSNAPATAEAALLRGDGADDVVDALARAEAVAKVRPSEDFESISVAFKRMKNILRQAKEAGKWDDSMIMTEFPQTYDDVAEGRLFEVVPKVAEDVGRLRDQKQYEQALVEVSKLRTPIDVFFEKVMVMVEEEEVRRRRLYLLYKLLSEFTTIADFSEIVIERKV
ncbi:MAG TPA: glycine--tRNA ligase subunit beta [Clostridia bacterium]|nr:glycine--tRNA ligase subunit beta [Clostridia bacterium]